MKSVCAPLLQQVLYIKDSFKQYYHTHSCVFKTNYSIQAFKIFYFKELHFVESNYDHHKAKCKAFTANPRFQQVLVISVVYLTIVTQLVCFLWAQTCSWRFLFSKGFQKSLNYYVTLKSCFNANQNFHSPSTYVSCCALPVHPRWLIS